MKNKTECSDEFRKGSEARQAHPLPSGMYKLAEVRRRLEESLQALTDFLSSTGSARAPGWLRRIPTMIARELGYNVIPAIAALTGDDLPLAQVSKMVAHSRKRCSDIVRRCDIARGRLASCAGAQYSRILIQDIMLEGLLQDTLDLVSAPQRLLGRARIPARH